MRLFGDNRGFTLVELTFAFVLLAVAFLVIAAALLMASEMGQASKEVATARNAAQVVMESFKALDFGDLYLNFQPGGVIGDGFPVVGLKPIEGDTDGLPGRIVMFVDERDASADATKLGLPRDLNGDGDINDQDVSGEYILLPVLIRIEWLGPTGNRQYELASLLANR